MCSQDSIESTLSEKMGLDSSVSVNQDMTTHQENVTISFAGNKSISPEEQAHNHGGDGVIGLPAGKEPDAISCL